MLLTTVLANTVSERPSLSIGWIHCCTAVGVSSMALQVSWLLIMGAQQRIPPNHTACLTVGKWPPEKSRTPALTQGAMLSSGERALLQHKKTPHTIRVILFKCRNPVTGACKLCSLPLCLRPKLPNMFLTPYGQRTAFQHAFRGLTP